MAIKFGTWTPSPSARPTPRHGSWCCPSGRRLSAPGGRFGPCTPWRPARNRPCSFKRNASPTRLSRSSWQSDWRERDRAPALPGLRVRAPRERALSRQGRAVLGRRAAVHGRVRRRDLAGGRAALLRGGDGAGPGTGGAAEAGVRAAGRQSGPGVRCRRGDRVAVRSAGDARLAPGGGLSGRDRSTTRRGACGVERDEPYPREFFRDPMTRTHGIRLLALVGAALGATLSTACGGARGAGSAALTPATPDSTALSLSPSVRSADSIGALAAPAAEPTFDIDVTSFATNRRVLEYLEFFQVDSRDRFEIWLARLGRYQGMIRERLRAKRLPEDLLYLCLIESGFSNTAVSRAKAVGMWQFMASTARLYGLTVDPWVDERRDPFRATEAAVNYLADLRGRLRSVDLAAGPDNARGGRGGRGIDPPPGAPGPRRGRARAARARQRRGGAVRQPAGHRAHHVRGPLRLARADAIGHRETLWRERHHDRGREPPHQGARAPRGAAAHHPDERTRRARLSVVGAPGAPLPARVEHRRQRREPPRAAG